ncbi:MAG: bifunctional phosphoribosyl-AMP cyclohydrolase/phosphoribosyl-ATP diphosphatase HisIE [Chloroflexi bacterium]|nr:bifunctional phosphoribosyl-AMP cyclohydrolase/phosphoribosyl-ATP diphosphatase HisIE [Chloroflexota bacterium]
MNIADLNYSMGGLLPVVVQHHVSGQVLMVGFANAEAVRKTIETRHAWFFSRSRQRLWEKGESSGNFLDLHGVRVDCDADALIYLCEPHGPTCHTGAPSCFFNTVDDVPVAETSGEAAAHLFTTILERQRAGDPNTSYVAKLLHDGVDRVAQKVGEEAVETVIAAKNADREEVAREVADLWFHSFILLAQQGMTPEDVWQVLQLRRR